METTAGIQRWQYGKLRLQSSGISFDADQVLSDFEAEMNRWGAEGWELVTVASMKSGHFVAFFKRPLQG